MIIKTLHTLLLISCFLVSSLTLAQQNGSEMSLDNKVSAQEESSTKNATLKDTSSVTVSPEIISSPPQVGKHVMANMNAGNMIISLLMVLALIIICAFVLKRFNFTQQGVSQLKVISSLSLGAKERVLVVQVGEQQLLLGVSAQQITLLDKLSEPLPEQVSSTSELPKNLLSFLATNKR